MNHHPYHCWKVLAKIFFGNFCKSWAVHKFFLISVVCPTQEQGTPNVKGDREGKWDVNGRDVYRNSPLFSAWKTSIGFMFAARIGGVVVGVASMSDAAGLR